MIRRFTPLFATALTVFATAFPVAAQITTGTVTGSIKDAQGAVVPGVRVTLVSATQGTTSDTHTNTDGDFIFPNVAAGTYILRVSLDGFKTLERPGVVVSPGERVIVSNLTLESGTGYLRGCFLSTLDLAIARNIRLRGGRNVQLRVDVFNAPNSAIITDRNRTVSLNNPTDPVTARNLPFDANGNLIDARSRPRGAGFGVATNYQNPRRVQFQLRFSF